MEKSIHAVNISNEPKTSVQSPQRQITIFDKQLEDLRCQLKSFGIFKNLFNPKAKTALNEQISILQAQAETCQKLEHLLGNIPLDPETQELFYQYPEIAPQLAKVLAISDIIEQTSALGEISVPNPEKQELLQGLWLEIAEVRHLTRFEFHKDQLNESEQKYRQREILDFSQELKSLPRKKPIYTLDPQTRQIQAEHVQAAQDWANEHGFKNTQWWPSALSGKGLLFCADWEALEHGDDGPLQISRQLGMLLGDRVRITRVTAEIPGRYTLLQAEHMLHHFNLIETGALYSEEAKTAARDFKETCKIRIQQLHAELVNNLEPQKESIRF